MCGIVGYVGPKDCSEVLVNALTKLEYRGYVVLPKSLCLICYTGISFL